MVDSNSPRSGALPEASQHAATVPAGGPPAPDPVALIRSRQYITALVLAALLGIPISAIAYGFLAVEGSSGLAGRIGVVSSDCAGRDAEPATASGRPRRLFEEVNATARAAGLLRGRRRVLDSTPLLDAVATQDTVTQLRAAIRKLLTVADREDAELAAAVRAVLMRDDDYATVGKPPCDWDDKAARDVLVDALVRDANVALLVLHGRELAGALGEAAELLALVAGQDVEQGEDGVFRIAQRVARDRVISTVDTEARHGHKSRARTFDGYKAHLAVDPDDELITNITVTPANAADRDVIDDLLDESDRAGTEDRGGDDGDEHAAPVPEPVAVFGDSAYGDGATLDRLAGPGTRCSRRSRRCATPRAIPRRVQHRPGRRHGGLPGRAHRAHPHPPRWRRPGPLFALVRWLPTARGLHHRAVRAGDHHPSARGAAAAGQDCAAGSGLAADLPQHPTNGGTQDRPLHPTSLGRTQARCRGQPAFSPT